MKAAYGGHQPGSRRDQTRHCGGDEEKQTHGAPQPPQGSAIVLPTSQTILPNSEISHPNPRRAPGATEITVTCHSNAAPVFGLEAQSVTL